MAAEPLALEAEFSLLEEFFGNRSEESDADLSDTSASDSESKEEDDASGIQVEARKEDDEEVEAVKNFIANTCGCSKKNGKPCSDYFDQNEYEKARMTMAELNNDQLD